LSRLVDKIEVLHVSELKPYARNARTHPPEQVEQLAESIRRFGFNNPILIDEDGIIVAGHGRLEGAKAAGLTHVPVIRVGHMTEAERRAYIIADNKIALNAGWDLKILSDELIDLDTGEIDLTVTGFSDDELADILASVRPPPERGSDADDIPEAALEPKVRTGEIYILGDHRLMCGDSTNPDDVGRLMKNITAHMVWTDPPYNVAYQSKGSVEHREIENDDMSDAAFYVFLEKAYLNMLHHTREGGAIYVAHADSEGANFRKAMLQAGWLLKQCLIWVKNSLVMGRQDYQWKHEPILYGWKPGAAHEWFADRSQTTVLNFDKTRSNDLHPTMKPVKLVEYMIQNSSERGYTVLDLFGGSGTTLIACEQLDRKACLMEIDPIYCGVILDRWQDFTKRQAVREADGLLWDQIRAE